MTDDEKELAKAGFESAFRPFANLAERLFGGAVDQIGGEWEDRLRVRRQIRQIKLLEKLQRKIDEARFAPQQIPDAIWIPVIQQVSLEDDGYLRDTWANLLANAADPRQENVTPPLFTTMLGDLRARDVKFLDLLYEQAGGRVGLTGQRNVADAIFGIGDIQGLYERSELSRTGNMTRRSVVG